jgi:hypothetical protein
MTRQQRVVAQAMVTPGTHLALFRGFEKVESSAYAKTFKSLCGDWKVVCKTEITPETLESVKYGDTWLAKTNLLARAQLFDRPGEKKSNLSTIIRDQDPGLRHQHHKSLRFGDAQDKCRHCELISEERVLDYAQGLLIPVKPLHAPQAAPIRMFEKYSYLDREFTQLSCLEDLNSHISHTTKRNFRERAYNLYTGRSNLVHIHTHNTSGLPKEGSGPEARGIVPLFLPSP